MARRESGAGWVGFVYRGDEVVEDGKGLEIGLHDGMVWHGMAFGKLNWTGWVGLGWMV